MKQKFLIGGLATAAVLAMIWHFGFDIVQIDRDNTCYWVGGQISDSTAAASDIHSVISTKSDAKKLIQHAQKENLCVWIQPRPF